MSHVVHVKTQVLDRTAVNAACQRLRLPEPIEGPTKLFSSTVTGLAVQLPQWRYPVVCDLPTGKLSYDNFNGHWGDPAGLDRFLQAYAVEKASLEARRQGHSVGEQPLEDGSIKLTIHVGGGVS